MSNLKGDESAFGVATGSGITLHLVLTHHWFDETEAGRKRVEAERERDELKARLSLANTKVTDAEPSTPASTRAQGPRSV